MTALRFRVDPRNVPTEKAARRIGLSEGRFREVADRLFARGFPRPDPDTGLYDLKAIDDWQDRQSGLTTAAGARDARNLVQDRLAGRAKEWDG